MPDWTADDLAREIERRRHKARGRSQPRQRTAEDQMPDWSDADWAKAFERRHGYKADPRMGRVRVRETDSTGAVLYDVEVHVFHLTEQAHPWQGYAWGVCESGRWRFMSAVREGAIRSAEDAVRASPPK